MRRTVKLPLSPTIEQVTLLLDTLRQHAECFNTVAAYGWANQQSNGVRLHKATYYPLRAAHPDFPFSWVCVARVRATEAVKSALTCKRLGRRASCPHSELPPIRYDARSYRVSSDRSTVSLSTTAGRLLLAPLYRPITSPPLTRPRASPQRTSSTAGVASGCIVVTLAAPEPLESGYVVGIDLGLRRPAVLDESLSGPATLARD